MGVKAGPSHPKYSVMIIEAMKELNLRTGCSRTAILKQIKGVHDVGDEKKASMYLALALKKGVEKGIFKKARDEGKNSHKFKLGENAEVKKSAKKPKVKKTTKKAKPSTGVKKTKAKKSTKKVKTSMEAKKPKVKKSIKKVKTSTGVKKPKAKIAVLPKKSGTKA